MAMNFPDSPSVDDTFTVGDQTWKWTGTTWDTVPLTEYSPSPHAATHELGGSDPLELDPTQVTGLDELNTGTAGYTALSNGTAGLSYQPVSHNYIINGAFDIWQRGTSFPSASGDYTADRWFVSASQADITQVEFTPDDLQVIGYGESQFFARYSTTGGADPRFSTNIEDVRTLAGQTVTLSFWAKSATADALHAVNLSQRAPAFFGGVSASFTGSLTTSWQRLSFTLNVPDIAGQTISDGSHLEVRIVPKANTALDLDLWGVQLEAGSIATPFKRNANSIAGEELACKRYYKRIDITNAGGVSNKTSPTSIANFMFNAVGSHNPPMRTNSPDASVVTAGTFEGCTFGAINTDGDSWVHRVNVTAGGTYRAYNEIIQFEDEL